MIKMNPNRPLWEAIKDNPEEANKIPEHRRYYDQGIEWAEAGNNNIGSEPCTKDFRDGFFDMVR